ncbi:unnamed protein product [Ixodes pacificus]
MLQNLGVALSVQGRCLVFYSSRFSFHVCVEIIFLVSTVLDNGCSIFTCALLNSNTTRNMVTADST